MNKIAFRTLALSGVLIVVGAVSAFAIYNVADGIIDFVKDASRDIAAPIVTPSPT